MSLQPAWKNLDGGVCWTVYLGARCAPGIIAHPLELSDVWKTATAASNNLKIWAAKFTARHPKLVAVELSSFKCGHDAPVYSVVERIIEQSGTAYFCFKDLNEDKPIASTELRVETIDYFLKSFGDTVQFGKQIVRSQLGSDISRPLNVGISSASRMPIADEE